MSNCWNAASAGSYDDRKERERSDRYDREMAADDEYRRKLDAIMEDPDRLDEAFCAYTAGHPGLAEWRALLQRVVLEHDVVGSWMPKLNADLYAFVETAAKEYIKE